MGSETVIQRTCLINSCELFLGDCDIILKGTVYLHSFVLNLVSFFVNKYC